VKSYRKRVIAKLGARNGAHAVALALRSGLLPME
jgi:DNA-binding CsgD family transcriptional regulator